MPESKCLVSGLANQQISEVQTVRYLLMEDEMESSPMRRRQLGMELRRLREQAGKTQAQAAEWAGLQVTAMSKIERGKQRVDAGRLRLLLQLYGVGSPHAEALERLRKEGDQRGWLASYGDEVPDYFRQYLGMETSAAEVWTYQVQLVPGLLQVPEYTTAIAAAATRSGDADQVQKIVEVRAARQQRLISGQLTLRAVIDEAALRRRVGGPRIMEAQLHGLAEAARLPNATIRVLPFAVGEHPSMLGAFTCLRFPDEPSLDVAYVEFQTGAIYLERPSQVERHAQTFEQLVGLSLSEDETAALFEQERRNWRHS